MPVEHGLDAAGRAAWRERYLRDWRIYRDSAAPHVGRNADAVDSAISLDLEDLLEARGEDTTGSSTSLIKKFRTEGTAVPARTAVSDALATVLDDPELHRLWVDGPVPTPAAVAVGDVDDDGTEVGEEDEPPADVAEAGPPVRGRRLIGALAVGVLILGSALIAVMAVAASNDDGGESGAPQDGAAGAGAPVTTPATQPVPGTSADPLCASAPGELDADLGLAAARDAWAQSLKRLHDDLGGDRSIGCTTEPAKRSGDVIVQPLRLDGVPGGVLVVLPDSPERAWWFPRSFWGNYNQVRESSVLAIGVPSSGIVEAADGHTEVETTEGVFVAEREDAPYFFIHRLHVDLWRERSDLGLPTSHPQAGRFRQEFQHGYATVDLGSGSLTDVEIHPVADPSVELPDGIVGHILEQSDRTSWWVPREGVRQWIPDVETWQCLGGTAKVVGGADGDPLHVPGYAISTLTFDGVASC